MRAPELRIYRDELIVDNSGRFTPGHSRGMATRYRPGDHPSPHTEFKPGERRGITTEFRKGRSAENKLPLGSVTRRRDPHGRMRAWVKVCEPNIWRLRYLVVWEAERGPLPRGMVIHHLDHNPENDAIENLVALTRAEHIAEHQLALASAAVEAAKARTVCPPVAAALARAQFEDQVIEVVA